MRFRLPCACGTDVARSEAIRAELAEFVVDGPAPSAESWSEITAVPTERREMFEARRDAVANGETEANAAPRTTVTPHR